ncbi:MAG: sulfatase [Imperialibacter sp.]|uniref:sulfatase family protein n=1 Tax=Imperialibacter sp. TaxID=2038411 RepID=UPI003A84A5A2
MTACIGNSTRLGGLVGVLVLMVGLVLSSPHHAKAVASKKPNIVFILADDLGYADLSSYGSTWIRTPNLDKLAAEGIRFTNFYAPAGVCTPTRASLMTGSYPKRVDLHVEVLYPDTKNGLNPNEFTLAEMLKEQGYATGMIGKWHLGLLPEVKPNAQGFDYYYGMPGPNHGRSDLYRNNQLVKANKDLDYDQITMDYTREARSFIQENSNKPFFLYMAHSAIHIPLYASPQFRRHEGFRGLYQDMTEELDWSCGEIVKELEKHGILDNTIVIFTSDNGPAGVAAAPLHGGKGSTWEAGFRVPLIVRWPEKIKAGSVSHELATMMDFYPTIAKIVGAKVSKERAIDGHNILPLLTGDRAKSEYEFLCYYGRDGKLAAIRQGDWKLHLAEPSERWAGKQPVEEALLNTRPTTALPWLYNLSTDIGETKNVESAHPDVVEKLRKTAASFDATLDAQLRPKYGAEKR